MPIQFDPAWEYFAPDPEIAEILLSSFIYDFVSLIDSRLRNVKSLGLRFGIGNPDKFHGKLAKVKRLRETSLSWVYCQTCDKPFEQKKKNQRYCDNLCTPRPGKDRILKDISCKQCGVSFRPKCQKDTYCGLICVSESQRKSTYDIGCKCCGLEIPKSESRNQKADRVYCSLRCKRIYINRQRRLRQKCTVVLSDRVIAS